MDERLPEEEDLMSRSIKKVKMNGENIVTESMEITEGETRETKQTSVTANDNQKTNEGKQDAHKSPRRSYRDMVVENGFEN
ncbi:hypothetical protein AHAS_Ahas16G0105500 [Arachis hypogaea]